MSVPVPNRSRGELEVNTKARELTVYTLRVLSNEKWFPQAQSKYADMIRECVLDIQSKCWEANNIKVDGDRTRYQRRINLQDEAADRCNSLCMLVETAKPLYHLRSTRVRYWITQAVALRQIIRGWREENAKRLKP